MIKSYMLVLSVVFLLGFNNLIYNWITVKKENYTVHYTHIDAPNNKEYLKLIEKGVSVVENFWGNHFKKEFDVYIHPSRHSIDSTWQKEWKMPDFKSECWMVASGEATRLHMISPKRWAKEACEHHYSETNKTRQLIAHELFHVYHGQVNKSPDFNNVEGIDWFIEGLATYASGQCDSTRLAEVKDAISKNKAPKKLDEFWTGKLKYGLSGSMVKYIDNKYGRAKLKELLIFNKKSEILQQLKISETELLNNWENYYLKLKI